jgi:hypothetical protein
MNKGLLRSAFLGGLIIFFWEIISWMGLPWHAATLHRFDNETHVAQVIMENSQRSGVYVLPNIHANGNPDAEMHAQIESGKARPLMFAAIQDKGMNPQSIPSFIGVLISYIIAAFFVSVVASQLKPASYFERVGLIVLIGLIIGVMVYVPGCVWWGFSSGFTMVGMLDLIIEWFFAGLVIAKLTR